jgi:hypothetical protein
MPHSSYASRLARTVKTKRHLYTEVNFYKEIMWIKFHKHASNVFSIIDGCLTCLLSHIYYCKNIRELGTAFRGNKLIPQSGSIILNCISEWARYVIQIKILKKNKGDKQKQFLQRQIFFRFKNYLRCIYSMDESVQWLPVTTDHCNTVLVPL